MTGDQLIAMGGRMLLFKDSPIKVHLSRAYFDKMKSSPQIVSTGEAMNPLNGLPFVVDESQPGSSAEVEYKSGLRQRVT